MSIHFAFKRWFKMSRHPAASLIRTMFAKMRGFEIPMVAPIHKSLYALHQSVNGALPDFNIGFQFARQKLEGARLSGCWPE